MEEILKTLYISLEHFLAKNTKKTQNDDLLTSILLTKTNKKNLLNIFEESAIFKYKLIENRENIETLKLLEDQNLVTKITKNTFDKYFINLNGLFYFLGEEKFNSENFIKQKNEELFSESTSKIKIKDEEKVFVILLILLGATSSETALQSKDKYENDLLFEFINNIYSKLLEGNLFSYNENNFAINWNNKKNKNFESFKTNVDSTTMYGIIKSEKNTKGTKWYLDIENENFVSVLFQKSDKKLEVYNEIQNFVKILISLKRNIDSDYYFKKLPPLSDLILEKLRNQCTN
jgi:hypothetical protein